jgi:hypothetical protein
MKLLTYFLIGASLAIGSASHAQDAKDVDKARAAAEHWLALADAGQRGASWAAAAEPFQAAVTKADWEKLLQSARAPLGAVKRRTLKSATYEKTLPGAPEGEYVVIVYSSEFANNAGATETVIPARAKDGSWKVASYFIR